MDSAQANKLLILSDGKPGHLNQSKAFARHLGRDFEILEVAFRNRPAKVLSYVADFCGLHLEALLEMGVAEGHFCAVVSAGSETYYANKLLAKRLGLKSVAIMLPQSYRYDFDLIVAQQHDDPPRRDNVLTLPINLTYVEPQGLVSPGSGQQVVSVIIGGDSKRARLDAAQLEAQLKQVFALFPDSAFWLSTSRRTPAKIEAMLQSFAWDYALYYSQQPQNPLADFLQHSRYVFVTADSTSMVSEAVSFGTACVEVLPAAEPAASAGKCDKMIAALAREGALHLFDGSLGGASRKIDLAANLQGVAL